MLRTLGRRLHNGELLNLLQILQSPPLSYNEMNIEHEENIGYVEDFENFVGDDIEGKNITVYPNNQHEKYEDSLDEEGIMTEFGDLPAYEHDPYVEDQYRKFINKKTTVK